jgi:hypothetical protein
MEDEQVTPMLPTYPAVLTNGRIEWSGEVPAGLGPRTRVRVTLLDPPQGTASDQGKCMAAALEVISARGGIATITDPLAWEREQRKDRELSGRES